MKRNDNWVMTILVFVALIILGLALSMLFPQVQGASLSLLGTNVVLTAVSLILVLLAFVLSWVMHVSNVAAKSQSEGIMTAITGILLFVFAPVLGAIVFVGVFLAAIVSYIGAILIGGGMGKAVAASTAPAANTLTAGMYPRVRRK